jgi:hypothetical protein
VDLVSRGSAVRAAERAAVLAGPTGGYLISFLVHPWLVDRRMLRRSHRIGWQAVVVHRGRFSFCAGRRASDAVLHARPGHRSRWVCVRSARRRFKIARRRLDPSLVAGARAPLSRAERSAARDYDSA